MSLISPSHSLERLEKQANRVHDVVRILVKYQLAGWLSAVPLQRIQDLLQHTDGVAISRMSHEERIRLAIMEMGTTYIKVGQLLSTRPDVVGPELATELAKLQTQTVPDSYDIVRRTVEEQLGGPPEEIFGDFETAAFASASVAQIHRATLRTGEKVAVKIQKSGIRAKVEADLSILATMADWAEKHSGELKTYGPVRLVSEFKRTILNELDFSREKRNLETFCANFAQDETVRFPRVWAAYSSERILTMDYMEGILSSDAVALNESGEDLGEFAYRGARVFLEMIFRDSFYHADPHPGNIMLMPLGVVGILDCGMVGRLDSGLHDDFESLMLAITEGDAEILTDTLWRLSTARPDMGRDQLLADLSDLLEDSTRGSIDEIDVSKTLNKLAGIIRTYRITLRPGLPNLMKTLVLLEGTAKRLNPKFSLSEVMKPYTERILWQRFSPQRIGRRFMRNYQEWDRLIQSLPRDVNQTLEKIQAGKFLIRLEHRNLDEVVNRLVLGIIVAALLLGSSLLWSLKAPPLLGGISIFGAAGYAVALTLGFLLYRAIERSGKVTPEDQ